MEDAAAEINAALVELLAEARREKQLTMEQLAQRAGLHRTYVGLLERGERQPTVGVVARLAAALGLSVADLIGDAERAAEGSGQEEPAVELVSAPPRRTARRDCIRPHPRFSDVTGMSGEAVAEAIDDAYHTLDLIDEQLAERQSPPVGELVELANLSSMLGNLLGAGLASASKGLYERNGPHKYPDLLAQHVEHPGLELKTALETNKPKGHLAKAGAYVTFRYVLVDKDGGYTRGREGRGNTVALWEVRFGELEEDDFSISNTPGDSGKTAVVKTDVLYAMELVYCDLDLLPYARPGQHYSL